ncbi:MAG: DUF58 domain-containing protein [Oscillospiraceae bacterium]|nr:DUF58 domain-containing protein [Oscillospiraceae bacterium]
MEDKLFSQKRSSLFITKGALAVMLFFGVLSAIFDATMLCIMFSFLFFFCLVSRIWGKHSLVGVEVDFRGEPTSLFPGQTASFDFVIKNDKLMPVIWLELVSVLGEDPPLYPADDSEVKKLVGPQAIDEGIDAVSADMLYKKFVFVMGHEEIIWKSVWEGRRRGIYRPGLIKVRTGDGFGLTQSESYLQIPHERCIAVYPALCNVMPDMFLRDMHDAVGAAKGFMEDITVIKSTRDYLPNDPAKRINWRATARTQKTVVNNYETILPKALHFIIDGESFNGTRPDRAAFEDSLSIVASLLLKLKDSGMRCGLSLPKSRDSAAMDITSPDRTPLSEILFALSGYELRPLEMPEDMSMNLPIVLPAKFNQGAIASMMNVGKYYYVCRDLKSIMARDLLTQLEPARVTLLPYYYDENDSDASLFQFETHELKKLKGGSKDE